MLGVCVYHELEGENEIMNPKRYVSSKCLEYAFEKIFISKVVFLIIVHTSKLNESIFYLGPNHV
jgi:hypothetical protein